MLPYQFQRDCFMPDATPEDTLAFGRLVLNRLAASAGTVRFSFAASRDAVPQQLSPFATELGLEAVEGEVPDRHAESLISVVSASRPAKDPVPPVGEGEKISGGAYTVQRQETDPFSAFAFGRLHVSELSPFYAGLSPPVRGSIIHTAAQALYAGLPSRNALQQWTARDVETRVEDASRRATDAYFRGADSVLRSLLKGERSRLQHLLRSLIECDLQRDDFTVHAVEREASLDQYGVLLSLRIDRLDTTPDGTYVLVDYKTGQEKRLLNRNSEINDLQLVVYEMAVPLEVGRLAIFNVDSRKTSFYSTAPDDDWPDLIGQWRERVDVALRNLARGHASVNLSLSTDQVRSYAILSRFEELRRD
jgi:hypothetical protein